MWAQNAKDESLKLLSGWRPVQMLLQMLMLELTQRLS
jgi:hypothetical protein